MTYDMIRILRWKTGMQAASLIYRVNIGVERGGEYGGTRTPTFWSGGTVPPHTHTFQTRMA